MRASTILFFVTLFAGGLAAPAKRQYAPGTNVNQGSFRPIIQQADGSVIFDGIRAANGIVGSQIACLLDEKDCLTGGNSTDTCTQGRVGCQSGNGLNGASSLLNSEPTDKRRSELVVRQETPGANANQGSDRPVIVQDDQSALVDGFHAINVPLGNQIACLLDEKDCVAGGKSADECGSERVSCQSGNGINGLTVKLNAETA